MPLPSTQLSVSSVRKQTVVKEVTTSESSVRRKAVRGRSGRSEARGTGQHLGASSAASTPVCVSHRTKRQQASNHSPSDMRMNGNQGCSSDFD